MTVIVTNAKNRIAYSIVRNLGQKGITVHTCDFVPLSMSFASRYSKGHFLYPSPFSNQEEFIECLIKNIHRLKAHVLIPVFEETYLIAKFKDEFSKHVKMVIPNYSQILIAHNKDRWAPIAKKLDVPVPKSYTMEELKNRSAKIKEIRFPVLIKPKQGGGAWAMTQINSAIELEALLDQKAYFARPWNRFFVQEKIDGDTICVAMLFWQGEYRAKVTYKQLRDYPVTGGQATLRISVHNEQAEEHFEQMLKYLKWHGICQADFIIDRKTNMPYLIDINPRFWGSLAQGIASGVDFPYLLFKIAIDGDVEPVDGFKTNVMTRWIGGDLRGFPQYLKQSNNKVRFIKDFFWPISNKVIYDDFDIADPLPFFTWCLDAIFKMIEQRSLRPTTHESLQGIWK